MAEGSTSPGHATRSVETARCVLTYAQVAPLPGAQTTSEQSGEQLLSELLTERREQWNGRRKYVEPAPPETNALPRLPDSWVWVSPEQIAAPEDHSLAIGPFGSNLKVSDYSDAGVPLVFVRNIRTERFNEDGTVYVSATKAADLKPHQVAGGDILVTKMGAPPGDACLYPETAPPAVITADCIKLRLAPRLIEKRFFVYAINSPVVRAQILSITSGVAQQKVSLDRFRSIGLPLPPLHEQRRIVVEIEKQFTRLDAGVAALRRTQANLKRYRAAVLKAACEGRLVPTEAEIAHKKPRVTGSIPRSAEPLCAGSIPTGDFDSPSHGSNPCPPSKRGSIPQHVHRRQEVVSSGLTRPTKVWGSTPYGCADFETGEQLLCRVLAERRKNWTGRGAYDEPVAPDIAGLPKLPNGWSWARLEQLGVVYGGLTKNPKRAKLPKQLPYLRVANVYADELRLDEIEYIGVADEELPKLLVRTDDLLIVEGNGSKDQIGRLAIWDGSIESCVHQNHIIKVRPVEARMSKWILHWLQSPGGRQFVELVASSTSGLFTLSVSKVGNLPIPVPPISEQTRIVAEVDQRLSVVEELESSVNANLQRATRLKQSILQQTFSGNLS